MYNVMSVSGSAEARYNICATRTFETSSVTSVPSNKIRSFIRRDTTSIYMSWVELSWVELSTDVKFVRFRKKYMMSITKSWGQSQSMTTYDLVRRLDTWSLPRPTVGTGKGFVSLFGGPSGESGGAGGWVGAILILELTTLLLLVVMNAIVDVSVDSSSTSNTISIDLTIVMH